MFCFLFKTLFFSVVLLEPAPYNNGDFVGQDQFGAQQQQQSFQQQDFGQQQQFNQNQQQFNHNQQQFNQQDQFNQPFHQQDQFNQQPHDFTQQQQFNQPSQPLQQQNSVTGALKLIFIYFIFYSFLIIFIFVKYEKICLLMRPNVISLVNLIYVNFVGITVCYWI